MRLLIMRSLLLIAAGLSLAACATTPPASEVRTVSLPPAPPPPPAPPVNVVAAPLPQDHQDTLETAPSAPIPARKFKLECTSGVKVTGQVDRWSPLSTCPSGYEVTGLSRIDLQGDHNRPNLHVNDFICDDRGCKAWCIGDGCTVEARCCRVSEEGPKSAGP
ncbi:MAG TPA: hypothetical protein VFO10_30090 [Oligoflexus sp.]|uniref:hypothetical protein n=1 Tax=Oligoflexus sp. TaxID=1971216 RepID=UPI002D7F5AB0|nr:hypothetical protein [Oligoflexus sp.]HET9241555.1 hypothetical protein [Oligoflexus sp.]